MNKKITVNLAVAIAIIIRRWSPSLTMILSMQLFNRTVSGVREKEIMYNKLSEMDKSARENYYGEIVDDTLYDYIAAGYVTGMGDVGRAVLQSSIWNISTSRTAWSWAWARM